MRMKKYLLLMFVIAVTLPASTFANKKIKDTIADNQLNKEEMKAGWQLLFDGKTLNGWKIFKGETSSSWQVVDGMLCSTKPTGDKNPDIISNMMYESFELQVDWKISPEG